MKKQRNQLGEPGARAPDGLERAVAIFHDIRNFRYCSDGTRDPEQIAARRAGSCSGKHILLRNRLRQAGYLAEIETVRGDFAAGIPLCLGMASDLTEILTFGGIEDFHHFVWLEFGTRRYLLDATWHDALQSYGFAVNKDWQGVGDTVPAMEPRAFLGAHEDIIAFKQSCLETLAPSVQERRLKFLALLSEWIDSVSSADVGNLGGPVPNNELTDQESEGGTK